MVLAPDLLGARIPAYSPHANVVSRRGGLVLRVLPKLEARVPGRIDVPRGAVDVQRFFHGADFATKTEILRRHNVDYVLVPKGSLLAQTLPQRPGVEPVHQPSPRYNLYKVEELSAISDQLLDPPKSLRDHDLAGQPPSTPLQYLTANQKLKADS